MIFIVIYTTIGLLMFAFSAGVGASSPKYKDIKMGVPGLFLGMIMFGLFWPALFVYAIGSVIGERHFSE